MECECVLMSPLLVASCDVQHTVCVLFFQYVVRNTDGKYYMNLEMQNQERGTFETTITREKKIICEHRTEEKQNKKYTKDFYKKKKKIHFYVGLALLRPFVCSIWLCCVVLPFGPPATHKVRPSKARQTLKHTHTSARRQ